MKTFIQKGLACAVAALALSASAAVAAPNIPPWAERVSEAIYKIPAGATRMIERHGSCRSIKNNQTVPMMVPTGTIEEWTDGNASFLKNVGSKAVVSNCPAYFYFLQGCALADHGQSECMVKPASKITLTPAQVKANKWIPEKQRPTGECRVGTKNWANVFVVGEFATATIRPMSHNGTDYYYYSTSWASGGAYLDQNGSFVIPHKNIANKLHGSTVNYSGKSENSRLSRMGWPNNNTMSCEYKVRYSLKNGKWIEWADYTGSGGTRVHRGNQYGGPNGHSMVRFVFVRTPGVPNIITNDVIDKYMVAAPPDPPS